MFMLFEVSDLEHDREELHEIARSDKNEIHELNIQLAEAQLANKNLKAQIARFVYVVADVSVLLPNTHTCMGIND